MGENLHGLQSGSTFRYNTKGTSHERVDKLDLIKIKNFCSAKDNRDTMKTQTTD